MSHIIEERARETVCLHNMFPQGSIVVAMVSGGGDSMALLHMLARGILGHDLTVSVLHVDHSLRDSSASDASFVQETCDDLGIPCRVARYDVAAYAEAEGLNLEDAGRRVRYRFAEEEVASRLSGEAEDRIVTAHTLDDSVETLLMRLAKGAGPSGLTGVPPVRGRVMRPLIDCRRADIRGYLRDIGADWREDETNMDVERLRAYARHELVPAFEAVNPRFAQTLTRTMQVISEEDRLLDALASDALQLLESDKDSAVGLDRAGLAALDPVIARRVVRKLVSRRFPECSRVGFEHVDDLVASVDQEGLSRYFPGGLRVRGEYGRIIFALKGDGYEHLLPSLLEIPGSVDLGLGGSITAELTAPGEVPTDPRVASIDLDVVSDPLTVDSVRSGDRFRPMGMAGTKKLSDLFVDDKVPERLRGLVPVVRDGDRIVWVAGLRLSEEYRVTDATTTVLRLTHAGRID